MQMIVSSRAEQVGAALELAEIDLVKRQVGQVPVALVEPLHVERVGIHAGQSLSIEEEFGQVADAGTGFEDAIADVGSQLPDQPAIESPRAAHAL